MTMTVKSLLLITCLIELARIVRCQGHRIVYPGETSGKRDILDLSKIRTRIFPIEEGFCVNESGQQGQCVFVRQCPELMSYLQRNGGIRTIEDVHFFRSRICRYLVNTVQLCCFQQSGSVFAPRDVVPLTPNPTQGSIIPTTDQCGFWAVGRITDGEEYTHGVHPWLAGVGFLRNDGTLQVLCGGTLVTRKHVMTAAHCFSGRDLTHVILGEHSLSKNTEREAPIRLRVASRTDPGYNSVSHVNDVAILTLERAVAFTDYIKPACLPFDLQGKDFEKEKFTIIGWGDTFHGSRRGNDVPLMAEVSGVEKAKCRESYKSEPQVPLDKTQFCANGGTKDACQGDSGGPLLYQDLQNHKRYFLVGIVSFGFECANLAFPGVYTFIPEFLNWMRDNLKE